MARGDPSLPEPGPIRTLRKLAEAFGQIRKNDRRPHVQLFAEVMHDALDWTAGELEKDLGHG